MENFVVLTEDELQEVQGGINPWIIAGVAVLIVFGFGFIDGYVNPVPCGK